MCACIGFWCLHCNLNLPIEQSKKHVLYLYLCYLDINNGQGRNSEGCINFYTDFKLLLRSLQQLLQEGGPLFRFMLPQQGLGEHPLSPGMPLLISAAINQFSSSPQPHQHSSHLLLLFLCTSQLPLGFFSSVLFLCHSGSQLWIGVGVRGLKSKGKKGKMSDMKPSEW